MLKYCNFNSLNRLAKRSAMWDIIKSDNAYYIVRGLVKLKKSKNPRKTRIGQTSNEHPPITIFFFETLGDMKTTQKTQNFQKK